MHGYDLYAEQQPIGFQPFQEGLVNDATVLAPVSRAGARYLIAQYPWARDKVVTLYLGSTGPETITHRSQDGTFRVVTCSQVIPVKRVDLIMDVVSEVVNRGYDNITWTHIGAGPGLAELERMICARPAISTRVTLLGDVAHQEVLQFLNHSPVDLFINLSTSEGLPVSLMEAASCGIPLLALDIGGVGEIVDASNGFLLPAKATVAQVADAVVSAMTYSDSATATLRAGSRQRWEQGFDAEVNAARTLELLVSYAGAS
jgi:glycosyltransferase involved in cell wall biosynthesis